MDELVQTTPSSDILALRKSKAMTDDELQEEFDRLILENRKIQYLQLLRQETGCTLKDALEQLYSRYESLREQSPEKFSVSHKDYWDGFYS